MARKLWHWTGEEFNGRRAFFPEVHIRLEVRENSIQAVFFKNVKREDFKEDTSVESDLDSLLLSYADIPTATIEPSRLFFDGSLFDQKLAGEYIQAVSMATLSRQSDLLGFAEVDGPALYAFPVMSDFSTRAPFNVLSKTFRMKRSAAQARLLDAEMWPVMVSVNDEGVPFTEANIIVRNSSLFGFKSNTTGWLASASRPENDGIIGTIPTLRILTPEITIAPDETAIVDVRVETRNGEIISDGAQSIYLEETGGYIPFKRVTAKNGLATFRVSALGIQAGECFKVKAGFRNFSGCAEVLVKVI